MALEHPASEVLRDVPESSADAYELIWSALARRYGYLDEPQRAMRLYDLRTQHPNETLVEYEIALRILYREAWPQGDEKMKDSSLKRKFEDGLQSPEMVQFLKLHARNDDFAQTVAKARQFQEANETAKPRRPAIRRAELHRPENEAPSSSQLQPVLDGLQRVLETVLQGQSTQTEGHRRRHVPSVRHASASRSGTPSSGQRSPSPASSQVSGRSDQQAGSRQRSVRFQEPPAASEQRRGSTGQRPPPANTAGGARADDQSRSYSPQPSGSGFRAPGQGQGQRQPPPWSNNRPWRDNRFDNRTPPPRGPPPPRRFGNGQGQGWRPRPAFNGRRYDDNFPRLPPPERQFVRPPPPRQQDQRSSQFVSGQWTSLPPRRVGNGCFVCNRFGCHSDFHREGSQASRPATSPQPAAQTNHSQGGPQLNGQQGSSSGDRALQA